MELINGDCLDVIRGMEPNSVDAIVTDPPYGLEFMGKEWDRLDTAHAKRDRADELSVESKRPFLAHSVSYQRGTSAQDWHYAWAVEALRVAKPGCHLLAFGGTRTFHRLACAIEDAGWEIRDTLMWVYGSGFPKSESVSLAIDKKACRLELEARLGRKPTKEEMKAAWEGYRKVVGHKGGRYDSPGTDIRGGQFIGGQPGTMLNLGNITAPATDAARQWEGWGTALKPAYESIVLARKPLDGTVAANVLKWGTGSINIDGCRVEIAKGDYKGLGGGGVHGVGDKIHNNVFGEYAARINIDHSQGRWPANLIHDGSEEVLELFPESSVTGRRSDRSKSRPLAETPFFDGKKQCHFNTEYTDSGSAARFFYTAKASRRERELGLDSIEIVMVEYHTWDNEDRKARLQVDTGQFPPRVIGVSGTPDNDASEWNTFLFGNDSMGQSLPAIPSITLTATRSITESKTLRFLVPLLIKDYIVDVNGKTASGGSPADIVDDSIPLLIITSANGVSRRGAGNVASAMRWQIKGNAASPADHPCVKPLALMHYLVRLVTPPNGTILDPFMGSGTTGMAAQQEGFRFIGIEKEKENVEIAERRIDAA